MARKLFFRGAKAFKTENYPEALRLYIASYKRYPKAVIIYNIAMCHRALFHYKKSLSAFRRYLAKRGKKLRKKKHRRLLALIKEAESKLAYLRLTIAPAGALVKMDGQVVGKAPFAKTLTLDPGFRTVEVSHPGFTTVSKHLVVKDGQRVSLHIALSEVKRFGYAVITALVPRAVVVVKPGDAPRKLPTSLRLPEGRHWFTVKAPGHKPSRISVQVAHGRMAEVKVALAPLPRRRLLPRLRPLARRALPLVPIPPKPAAGLPPIYARAWFWTVVGVAVAGAAAAVGGYYGWRATQGETVDIGPITLK